MRMILAPPIATNLDRFEVITSKDPRPFSKEVGLSGAVSYTKTYTIMGILGKPTVNKPLIRPYFLGGVALGGG